MEEICSFRQRALPCVLFVVALLASISNVQADDGLDSYNHSVGLYKQQRWKLAAENFQKFLKEHRKHVKVPYARLYLGLTLINLERYEDARKGLRGYVKDYPKSKNLSDAMYRVAECSYMLDDSKSAETEFLAFLKQAKPKDPLLEWALPYLADCQLKLKKPKEAAANFQKSIDQFPKGRLAEDSKFSLAICFEELNQPTEAIKLYKELSANQLGVRAPQAQMNLAAHYFDSEQFDLAAAEYELMQKRFAKSELLPQARLNAGFANYQQGQFEKAAQQFELAAKTKSQAVTAQYWQGLSNKSLGKYGKAIELMKTALAAANDGPQAEEILYQLADSELRQHGYAKARKRYLELVTRWPRGDLADDSLHFAAETALLQALTSVDDQRAAHLKTATELLDRFASQYPNSGLAISQKLLRGRVLLAEGSADKLTDAAKLFETVMESSTIERTKLDARYQLARVKQMQGTHLEVIDVVAPLIELVERRGNQSAYVDVLVLAAISLSAEEKHAASSRLAKMYSELSPKGAQADQALSLRATSEAHLGNQAAAQESLDTLKKDFAKSPTLARTLYRTAEIAYDAEKWDWSLQLFASSMQLGEASPYYAASLSGAGWCHLKKKDLAKATAAFREFVQKFQKHELAPEAAYQVGNSLQQDGKTDDAITAYKSAFEKYAPSDYAYKAGLNVAQMLSQAKKYKEADAAYEVLLKKYPKPKDLDVRLDEWALMNQEAENYDRADKVFARLVKETPKSDLVDNARYSLAESDLIAGKLDEAKKVFRELETDEKSDDDVRQDSLYKLLAIATEQSKWKDVVASADQLDKRFKEGRYNLDATFYRGEAQLHLGRLKDARATFQSLKDRKDDTKVGKRDWFPHVWTMLAEVYVQDKDYDSVVKIADEFRQSDSQSPFLYRMDEVLGRCYKNQSKFDKAREAFERAIKSTSGRRTETAAKCQLFLAETYFLQKQWEKALSEYLKVYNLYDYPEWRSAGLLQAAICDEQLQNWDDAVRSYELLLEKFPKSQFASKAKARLPEARKRAGAG